VTETVQVVGDSPLIDVKTSGRATNLRAEDIEKMPKGRDFTSLITQAPGANFETKSGGYSLDGASAAENRFVIDGAETTDIRYGTSGKRLITDFVEEVQIKSSGYAAEYGGATGGVINAITKSGSNAFHGEVGTYYSSDALGFTCGREQEGYCDGRESLRRVPTDSSKAEHVNLPRGRLDPLGPGLLAERPAQEGQALVLRRLPAAARGDGPHLDGAGRRRVAHQPPVDPRALPDGEHHRPAEHHDALPARLQREPLQP
jgi:hypothetical protein